MPFDTGGPFAPIHRLKVDIKRNILYYLIYYLWKIVPIIN